MTRNDAMSDDEHDWVAAGDISPYQARVLLVLALTQTSDTDEIQRFFKRTDADYPTQGVAR